MANSYGMGYMPQYGYSMPSNQQNNSKKGPSVFGMTALGFAGGGTVGYLLNKNPIKNDGAIPDDFVKQAFDNFVEKGRSDNDKNAIQEIKNILKKIDGTKTPEGLKELLNKNKIAAETIYQVTPKELLEQGLNTENLSKHKKSIKSTLEAQMQFNHGLMEDAIKSCWNSEKKEFSKPSGMSDKMFNIIKETKTKSSWKKALKYGGITAGVLGALTLGYKMLINRQVT